MKLGCTGHPESYLMVAVDIFLRELRGRWQKANPALSPLAFTAARTLGFLPSRISNDPGLSLACLQHLWGEYGMTAESFPDFEAALVRGKGYGYVATQPEGTCNPGKANICIRWLRQDSNR